MPGWPTSSGTRPRSSRTESADSKAAAGPRRSGPRVAQRRGARRAAGAGLARTSPRPEATLAAAVRPGGGVVASLDGRAAEESPAVRRLRPLPAWRAAARFRDGPEVSGDEPQGPPQSPLFPARTAGGKRCRRRAAPRRTAPPPLGPIDRPGRADRAGALAARQRVGGEFSAVGLSAGSSRLGVLGWEFRAGSSGLGSPRGVSSRGRRRAFSGD
jgi:hypothetical protein